MLVFTEKGRLIFSLKIKANKKKVCMKEAVINLWKISFAVDWTLKVLFISVFSHLYLDEPLNSLAPQGQYLGFIAYWLFGSMTSAKELRTALNSMLPQTLVQLSCLLFAVTTVFLCLLETKHLL